MQAQGAPPGQYTVSFYLDDEDQVGSGSFTTDGNGNWGPGEVATWDTTNRGDDTYNFYAKYIRLGVDPPPANEDGSYTVTIANTYPAWEPPDINGNGIQCSGITAPSDNSVYAWSSGLEIGCTCAEATDNDHRYYSSGSPQNTYPSDTLAYYWNCHCAGSWKNGVNTGRNVTWVDGGYGGNVWITCTVYDTGTTSGEHGSRDDTDKVYDLHFKVIKILTETFATSPSNRGRTGLGIGEEVFCWTDGGIQVNWELSGSAPLGSLSATTNTDFTNYTAPKSPASPTLHATLSGADATVEFSVIAPGGQTSAKDSDHPLGDTGRDYIGAESWFKVTVLPTTVSFYNASFRENIPAQEGWTWPNGTDESVPAQIGALYSVSAANLWDSDHCAEGMGGANEIGLLKQNQAYVYHSHTLNMTHEYQNDQSQWVSWYTNQGHFSEYQVSDQAARLKRIAGNTAEGGWQGPYKY